MEGTMNRKNLNILCLHGYRQNNLDFSTKTGAFRKAISKYAQLVYISAPHIVEEESANRSWWFNADDKSFSGKRQGGPAIGFTESLQAIEQVVENLGPFDGIMGFSQGASLVSLLAGMQQKGLLPYSFDFAIIVSGFKSGSVDHQGFYEEQINLPSLHVYGETDTIIPIGMSETLKDLFVQPVVAKHPGGHYMACKGPVKDAYIGFLREKRQAKFVEQKENET